MALSSGDEDFIPHRHIKLVVALDEAKGHASVMMRAIVRL